MISREPDLNPITNPSRVTFRLELAQADEALQSLEKDVEQKKKFIDKELFETLSASCHKLFRLIDSSHTNPSRQLKDGITTMCNADSSAICTPLLFKSLDLFHRLLRWALKVHEIELEYACAHYVVYGYRLKGDESFPHHAPNALACYQKALEIIESEVDEEQVWVVETQIIIHKNLSVIYQNQQDREQSKDHDQLAELFSNKLQEMKKHPPKPTEQPTPSISTTSTSTPPTENKRKVKEEKFDDEPSLKVNKKQRNEIDLSEPLQIFSEEEQDTPLPKANAATAIPDPTSLPDIVEVANDPLYATNPFTVFYYNLKKTLPARKINGLLMEFLQEKRRLHNNH